MDHTILIIDDSPEVLASLEQLPALRNLKPTTTTSPYEALHLASLQPFSLIICDQKMPLMSGVELLEKIRQISPDTVRILLSDTVDTSAAAILINQCQVYKLLLKSWDEATITAQIMEALKYFDEQESHRSLPGTTAITRELHQDLIKKTLERAHENQHLLQTLERQQVGYVESWIAFLQAAHPKIWAHSRRVASIAVRFGRQLGLPQAELHQLEVAALLHDLGMTGMISGPHMVELAQKHPEISAGVLDRVDMYKRAATIIRCHQERFDGGGFPNGLQGNAIPLGARILHLVDNVDERLKPKHMRSAAAIQQAVDTLDKDPAFDPALVYEFQRYVDNARPLSLTNPWDSKGPEGQYSQYLSISPEWQWQETLSKPELHAQSTDGLGITTSQVQQEDTFPSVTTGDEPGPAIPFTEKEEPTLLREPESFNLEALIQKPLPEAGLPDPAIIPTHGEPAEVPRQTVNGYPFVAEAAPCPPYTRSSFTWPVESRPQPHSRPGNQRPYQQAPRRKTREVCILPEQLQPGMVISRDLVTQKGLMLLRQGSVVTLEKFQQLRKFMDNDPPIGGIYICS